MLLWLKYIQNCTKDLQWKIVTKFLSLVKAITCTWYLGEKYFSFIVWKIQYIE